MVELGRFIGAAGSSCGTLMPLMQVSKASIKPSRKRENEGVVLVDPKLLELPVFFVEVDSMSLSEIKSQDINY